MTLMQHEFFDLRYIPRLPSNLPLGHIYQYNFNVYSTQKLSEKGLVYLVTQMTSMSARLDRGRRGPQLKEQFYAYVHEQCALSFLFVNIQSFNAWIDASFWSRTPSSVYPSI